MWGVCVVCVNVKLNYNKIKKYNVMKWLNENILNLTGLFPFQLSYSNLYHHYWSSMQLNKPFKNGCCVRMTPPWYVCADASDVKVDGCTLVCGRSNGPQAFEDNVAVFSWYLAGRAITISNALYDGYNRWWSLLCTEMMSDVGCVWWCSPTGFLIWNFRL